jgi:hypothetical protein
MSSQTQLERLSVFSIRRMVALGIGRAGMVAGERSRIPSGGQSV